MIAPDQGNDGPIGTSSPGAARSVDVISRVGRGIEVDHERHSIDVDPARGDVGGNKHIEPACTKRRQGALALALAAVPMDGSGPQTGTDEAVRDAIRPTLGAAEHEGRAARRDDLGRHGDPIAGFHPPEMVRDLSSIGIGQHDVVAYRVVLVITDQLVDRSFQRRREQEGLARDVGPVHQVAHHREKAHIRHLVGFVDDNHVHVRQLDGASFNQVGESSRTGDEHVDAAPQGGRLLPVADAAVDRGHPGTNDRGQRRHDLLDLCGELAGGDQDESRGMPATLTSETHARQPGKDRQRERKRLSRSGGRLAAHVAPGKGVGQGCRLDREGGEDPLLLQGCCQRRRNPEVREAGGRQGGG